jgi:hypothetical protein
LVEVVLVPVAFVQTKALEDREESGVWNETLPWKTKEPVEVPPLKTIALVVLLPAFVISWSVPDALDEPSVFQTFWIASK